MENRKFGGKDVKEKLKPIIWAFYLMFDQFLLRRKGIKPSILLVMPYNALLYELQELLNDWLKLIWTIKTSSKENPFYTYTSEGVYFLIS